MVGPPCAEQLSMLLATLIVTSYDAVVSRSKLSSKKSTPSVPLALSSMRNGLEARREEGGGRKEEGGRREVGGGREVGREEGGR